MHSVSVVCGLDCDYGMVRIFKVICWSGDGAVSRELQLISGGLREEGSSRSWREGELAALGR